ncbi:MAG: M20/M25/M40 family metallo-hydrolase [Verrucomicrobiota bacterium]
MRSVSLHPRSATELLQELVAIPSVNPHGAPGTDLTGEHALANYVADFLREAGAEVRLEDVLPRRPNVLAEFHPAVPRAHIAFAPHLDTVSVLGMTIPPFDAVLREGKLYGRGATDTKGPMAAALWALRDWAASPERASSAIHWSFLALANEEAGNTGAQVLADRGFSCDLMIVLEPTEMKVVTAQKGILWAEARAGAPATPRRRSWATTPSTPWPGSCARCGWSSRRGWRSTPHPVLAPRR